MLHVGGLRTLWVWIGPLALVWILNSFITNILDAYYFSILMFVGINIILAVSLNLVNGFTGQFSMGHAGFMSVGAYVSAYLSIQIQTALGGSLEGLLGSAVFFMNLVLGGFAAALVGYAVGLPSLRLKGDYLAIVTLGAGEIVRVVLLNIDAVGGPRGLPGVPPLANFGWVFSFVILTIFMVWRLMHSPMGRELLSVREDEIAAEAMGVDTTKAKVRAFVVGAFFAGIAGGLFGHFLQFLSPQTFDFNKSFEVIIMVVLGGMGSLSGSVVAAVFLTVIREALRPLQEITKLDFRMVIYSLVLIILMLTRPNGIFGTKEILHYLPEKIRKRLLIRGRLNP